MVKRITPTLGTSQAAPPNVGVKPTYEKNKNDINIGNGRWIKWVDIPSSSTPFDLDPYMKQLDRFFKQLEYICLSECCCIDAYDFDADEITGVAGQFEAEDLLGNLDKLEEVV